MIKFRLGIDIGGTFTDFALIDSETGKISFNKSLTTINDPSEAILNGANELLKREKIKFSQIDIIIHGTTLATNALIERKGAKTALITTQGFRDIIEMRRETRYDLYDLFIDLPEPVVPRYLRFGVEERVDKDGRIITPLNENQLVQIIDKLIKENIESIAVCFLHSYTNPANEKKAGELITKMAAPFSISLSNEVAGAIREDERFSTTSINAYIKPLAERYMRNLLNKLIEEGFKGKLFTMLSNGGLTTFENAVKFPVRLIESGPAGGTMAGVFFSDLLNIKSLIAFDMGGTTAKISVIRDGRPSIISSFEAARLRRFMKGSGLPIMIPAIDMIEIGAGGGSIAWVDSLGLLRVGPESSGADPGPACYGKGGKEPTVTDAALILGYLNPDYFLGGEMKLDKDKAILAIERRIATPLGLGLIEASWGIHRIVIENMASAARIHILEKGYDPRKFTLLAFGGAGPIHAWQVAKFVGFRQIIAPFGAGVMSALGFLVTPVATDLVQTYLSRLDEVDWDRVNFLLESMERKGIGQIIEAGVSPSDVVVTRSCDMRYVHQGREVNVPIPNGELSRENSEMIIQSFYSVYKDFYSRYLKNVPIETVNWRVAIHGPKPKIQIEKYKKINEKKSALKNRRAVYFEEYKDFIECPIYDRYRMEPGTNLTGPAIIEEKESTLVVGPGGRLTIDDYMNAIVDF